MFVNVLGYINERERIMASTETLLKPKDAAKYLGVHKVTLTVYRNVGYRGKKLRAIRIGGRYWYDPADLDAWMIASQPATPKQRAKDSESHRRAKEYLKRQGYFR